MKKVLAACLTALVLGFTAHQQAFAWSKYNFGVGMNVGWEGGGNSFLWGVASGARTPGNNDGYSGGPQGFGPGSDHGGFPVPLEPTPSTPPAKPMPQGTPSVAQPVGYYHYAAPGYGYYPQYYYSPGYGY